MNFNAMVDLSGSFVQSKETLSISLTQTRPHTHVETNIGTRIKQKLYNTHASTR